VERPEGDGENRLGRRRPTGATTATWRAQQADRVARDAPSHHCGLSADLLFLAVSCLVVAGGADVISTVTRSVRPADAAPDDRRARFDDRDVAVAARRARIDDAEADFVAAALMPTIAKPSMSVTAAPAPGVRALLVLELARYPHGVVKMRSTS
jgi:hypothetical protein